MKCQNIKCNKEHKGAFGSGKFCSRACANSRNHTEEIKNKISIALTKYPERQYAIKCKLRKPIQLKPLNELKSFNTIRYRIFKERGRICENCGWCKANPFTGIIPVQIDHIDGDNTNNKIENLKILCPNCHSMTQYFMFYGRSHKGKWGKKGTKRYRSKEARVKRIERLSLDLESNILPLN